MESSSTREVLVVTGGASGIGLECAIEGARRGALVAILDRELAAAQRAAQELPPGRHLAIGADVADSAAVSAAIARIAEELGEPTSIVAAAGIVSRTPLREVTEAEFERVLRINVLGVNNVIAAAVPHLITAGERGAIVALGSVAASTGGGLMGSGVYATSKAAVVGLIRGYARELAPWGVRANVVAPGATETPMTRSLTDDERSRILAMTLLGRMSRVDEIAGTVSFLLSRAAATITGQVIQPNSGVVLN